MGEARNVEFCTLINFGKSYLTHDKIPANGRGQVQGPNFYILGPPTFGSDKARHFYNFENSCNVASRA